MSELQTAISSNTSEISLNTWIFERVQEYVTGRVLEIDTAFGILSPICLQNKVTTDVISINLADASFDENYAALIGAYDTVIALQIADQIASNRLLAINCKKLLKPGGHFITLLPARTALYKGLDQGFKRWKFYNLEFINKVLQRDYSIIKTRYFIVAKDQPSPQWITKYSERVTLFNTNNVLDSSHTGLSIIAVGRKRS